MEYIVNGAGNVKFAIMLHEQSWVINRKNLQINFMLKIHKIYLLKTFTKLIILK